MTKNWTLSQCFQKLGTVPKNPRWSWSGRSPAGDKVSVTLWRDRFEKGTGTRIYRSNPSRSSEDWVGSNGHVELIENLVWARDNLDGEVSVIIAVARDPDSTPRQIEECYPQPNLRMRVTELDESTGDFCLERVG
ncbi:MAG: hypothetical protein RIC18_04535 [Hoeflea sp.]|uniref:hypothetical protein n=1 Tax=Hoeflea sp. TaxID=1940281 RepID=UPI0032EE944C